MSEVSISVPVCPPSVNRTRRIDRKGQRLLAHWHQYADKHLMATMRPFPRGRITKPFVVYVVFSDRLRRDLDNCLKALLDYAVRVELVPDDSWNYMRELHVKWGPIEGCQLTIREVAA